MDPSFPPLWHSAGVGLRQPSARWHTTGDEPHNYAQYLSCHPLGMWTELARQEGLRGHDRRRELYRTAWMLRVRSDHIADLRSFEHWDACGLDPWIAVDDDHGASRKLAEELQAAGFHGMLSASASLPGAINLTLFGPRMEIPYTSASAWPRPEYFCPTSMIAERAIAPPEVITHTRFKEQPHLGFEDYQATAES